MVKNFKYLGFTFNEEGNYVDHIKELKRKGRLALNKVLGQLFNYMDKWLREEWEPRAIKMLRESREDPPAPPVPTAELGPSGRPRITNVIQVLEARQACARGGWPRGRGKGSETNNISRGKEGKGRTLRLLRHQH